MKDIGTAGLLRKQPKRLLIIFLTRSGATEYHLPMIQEILQAEKLCKK